MTLRKLQITNYKLQTNSKSQAPNFKQFGILVIGIWLLFVIWNLVFGISAQASSSDNVSGFAWSPNVGWISFNSTSDGSAIGYGVAIDSSGFFSGYAWSSHFGWLSFNDFDASHPRAQVQPSGAVTGWARFLNNGGAWDGWVRFDHGQTNPVTLTSGAFSGYAWGGSSLGPGWILMDGVSTTYSPVSAPSGLSAVVGYCGAVYNMATFSWSGSLPPGPLGSHFFTFQIDKNKNGVWGDAGDWVQSVDVTMASVSFGDAFGLARGYSVNPGSFQWRVGVDNSNWSSIATLVLQPHDSPVVGFSLSSTLPNPLNPKQRQFNNTSSCVSGFPCAWVWTMPSDVVYKQGTNINSQAPLVEFPDFTPPHAKYNVTLQVADSAGYTCSRTDDQVSVGNAAAAVPQWRRWLPF